MSDPDPVRAAFDKFDADGSGKLERGELMRVFGALGLDVLDEEFVSYAKALTWQRRLFAMVVMKVTHAVR